MRSEQALERGKAVATSSPVQMAVRSVRAPSDHRTRTTLDLELPASFRGFSTFAGRRQLPIKLLQENAISLYAQELRGVFGPVTTKP